MYDVDRVARWLSKQIDPGTNAGASTPPQTTHRSLTVPGIHGTVTDVVFLQNDHVVASIGKMMFCWKLSKKIQAASQLVWRFQPPSRVTAIAPLGSNLVVVGTSQGHLSILNWTIHNKEHSFSNERRPLVLQTWIPHTGLKEVKDDNRLQIGILKLRIEPGIHTTLDAAAAGDEHWGICRATWVTQGGWLLSTTMESPTVRGGCFVHHATPKVTYQNTDGEVINTHRQAWSIPQEPVGVHLSDYAVCLAEVPAVTNILSHHNKFVLDSQPSIIRSRNRSVLIQSRHDRCLNSISLPGSIKKIPQTFAVHPTLEWIAVGDGEKLHILVGRDCRYKNSSN